MSLEAKVELPGTIPGQVKQVVLPVGPLILLQGTLWSLEVAYSSYSWVLLLGGHRSLLNTHMKTMCLRSQTE